MNQTATIPASRPATVWDLLAIQHTIREALSVSSHQHADGSTTEWEADFNLADRAAPKSPSVLLTGRWDPTVTRVLDLDLYDTPAEAARHRIHADGLGVTLCATDGTPQVTYRLPEGTRRTLFNSPAAHYAQDYRTYKALAEALTRRGASATADDLDHCNYVTRLGGTPVTPAGYYLFGNWQDPETGGGWFIQDDTWDAEAHGGCGEYVRDAVALDLPLDADVDTIAEAVIDWLREHDTVPTASTPETN